MENLQTSLILVRHGQSGQNISDYVSGHHQEPLTDLGVEQARSVGRQLEHVVFGAAYSSDLARTHQTAQIILEGREIPIVTMPDLRERFFGIAEGQSREFFRDQLLSKREAIASLGDEERFGYGPIEGMESDEDLVNRVIPALKNIAEANRGKTILVTSHGALMRVLLTHLGLGSFRELASGTVKNTAYVELIYDGDNFVIVETFGVEKRVVREDSSMFDDFISFHMHTA